MKAKLIALGAASLLALCACSSTSADDESAKVILLGNEPQNDIAAASDDRQAGLLPRYRGSDRGRLRPRAGSSLFRACSGSALSSGQIRFSHDRHLSHPPLERERKSAEVVAHAVTGEHRRF